MDRVKSSRPLSFAVVAAVYVLAAAVGAGIYMLCPGHFALRLLAADAAATAAVFIFSLIFGNASVYDPYWSVQPPVIVTAYAIAYGVNLTSAALLVAIWFWGIRLTANWAYTFRGLTHQDWRYTMLCEKTGRLYPLVNLVGIHMVPTLVVYGCTLPAVYAIVYGFDGGTVSVVCCLLAIMSAAMQGMADIQMHTYRRNRPTPFISVGLWKHSRHPNYLCEIMQWWWIALAVCAGCGMWQLMAGAVANTMLFLFISIPMADKRRSEKDGWQEYKRRTRALLPIAKRR